MTLQQAEDYVSQYRELLADPAHRGGRQNPSLLPTSKEVLVKAIKLVLANLYFNEEATEQSVQDLIGAAMFLDSFTHATLDTATFVDSMRIRRHELESFYVEVLNVSATDPFFWQRVYALVGLDCETKSSTLFRILRAKFGLASREGPHAGVTV